MPDPTPDPVDVANAFHGETDDAASDLGRRAGVSEVVTVRATVSVLIPGTTLADVNDVIRFRLGLGELTETDVDLACIEIHSARVVL